MGTMNSTYGNLMVNSEGRISRADANALKAQRAEREARAADVRRAENLRKSRAIANVKPGTGPRIAR